MDNYDKYFNVQNMYFININFKFAIITFLEIQCSTNLFVSQYFSATTVSVILTKKLWVSFITGYLKIIIKD